MTAYNCFITLRILKIKIKRQASLKLFPSVRIVSLYFFYYSLKTFSLNKKNGNLIFMKGNGKICQLSN